MHEIVEHYEQNPEEPRLLSGWGRLELVRTQELILRHLAPAPATILDVGGGTGIYSAWLGGLGYQSHLIDLTPRHAKLARQEGALIASAQVGDARRLPRRSDAADAVLLLGPLYHLTEREDRLTALGEARRVLRSGGLLFAAAISRFASLFDSLVSGFIDDSQFTPLLDRDLTDGQHRNETGNPHYFTTAFFHRHEELESEVRESGFSLVELAAIEGPCWLAKNLEERWADPARREQLLAGTHSTSGT
jgi:SAM-dependent methyltransferase